MVIQDRQEQGDSNQKTQGNSDERSRKNRVHKFFLQLGVYQHYYRRGKTW
jgi:hypothetical protein